MGPERLCPNCRLPVRADSRSKHCGTKGCPWVLHPCGMVVDPKSGRAMPQRKED